MSRIRFVPLFLLLSVCAPAFAATHTWLGTVSNVVSDPGNWEGGVPTDDPEARIVFSGNAVRTEVLNDVAGLRVREMVFVGEFTLSGEPLAVGSGSIGTNDFSRAVVSCDIAVSGTLSLHGGQYTGTISGAGGLVVRNSVVLGGNTSNSYGGETRVEGSLVLRKSPGALAVPGNLVIETGGMVEAGTAEQISPAATVDLRSGARFFPRASQTIARIICAEGAEAIGGPEGPLTVHELVVNGKYIQAARLRLTSPVLDLPESGWISVRESSVPDGGLTVRGSGTLSWSGDVPAKVIVEGALASFNAPATDAVLKSGRVSGLAGSLTASGGQVEQFESRTDLRLGPGVTLIADEAADRIRLNGTFDPAGATLDVLNRGSSYTVPVIISNASKLPAASTFAGIPEGGTASNLFTVSYTGGDGNDVTVRRIDKLLPWLELESSPKPSYIGAPVTISATVGGLETTPTGSVTFTDADGRVLGTVTLTGGKASLPFTPREENPTVYVQYSGDPLYGPYDDGFVVLAGPRLPVITSIDPPSAVAGGGVTVTVRGEHFLPDMQVSVAPLQLVEQTTFVSSTELRATLDLRMLLQTVLQVTVVQPTHPSSQSNTMAFPVTAVSADAMITFGPQFVVGHVGKGAKTAWITSAGDRRPELVADPDQDGVVFWPRLPFEHVGVVDLASGRYEINVRDGSAPRPFPATAFTRDAAGNVTLLTLPAADSPRYSVLWVRRGTGAWAAVVEDGNDRDGIRNGQAVLSTAGMTALDTAPVPPAFAPGDLVIAMSSADAGVYAATLADNFDSTAPGQLAVLGATRTISENAGVVRLPVVRTNGTSGTVSVRYATAAVTATPGVHYTHTAGTVTFGPAEMVQWIEVPILDDAVWGGGSRMFRVVLSDAEGAALGGEAVFAVTIADDDPRPVVAYAGEAERHVFELDAPSSLPLDLTLTGATLVPATVDWYTTGGVVAHGRVTFAPGERFKSIQVPIPGDDVFHETDARIQVVFDADGAQVAQRLATIVVEEDDQRLVAVDSEPVFRSETAREAVILLAAPQAPFAISLDYETAEGTATAGADFTMVTGSVGFYSYETQKAILVPLVNDSELEGDETFTVRIRAGEKAQVTHGAVTVVIRDDELTERPAVSIGDTTIVEGDQGLVLAAFPVTLSAPSPYPVTVYYATADGAATEGPDYEPVRGTIGLAPGQTASTIWIPVRGDRTDEPDEMFTVRLTGTRNGDLGRDRAQAVIVDDDVPVSRRRVVRP